MHFGQQCYYSITDTLLLALNLTLFPVLFFFTFLYYTDVGATLFTLVGYLCARRDHHFLSAMVRVCVCVCVCVCGGGGGGGGGLVVKWFVHWAHDPWVMGSSPTTRR